MIRVKGIKQTLDMFNSQKREQIKLQKNLFMLSLVNSLKKATPVDTGKARDGWHQENNAIVNEVEYIDYLNEGTSQQAPAYFIEQTVLSHPGVKPNGIIVKKK
jgi:hypothetical protein